MSEIRTLYEDAQLLVIDKPAGLLTIPGRGPQAGADVLHLLEGQRGEKLWVVHRLDRGTSGALAFARDATTHKRLSQAFEHGEVAKLYLALVAGRVEVEEGLIERALVPGRRGKMRPAGPNEEGKPSQTRFRVRERFQKHSLLECEPLTGRQHQIRVHLSSLGHPLAVDEMYRSESTLTLGDFTLARTPLHCARMTLPLEAKRNVTVEAPLPEDLSTVLARLRAQEIE